MKNPYRPHVGHPRSARADAPELIGDIFSDGIVVTGGSALLGGLSELITSKTGVQVRIPEDPISCVVKGTGEALPYIDQLQGGVYNYRTVEDLRK